MRYGTLLKKTCECHNVLFISHNLEKEKIILKSRKQCLKINMNPAKSMNLFETKKGKLPAYVLDNFFLFFRIIVMQNHCS